MLSGRRKLKELKQLQTMHPGQPWLWRRDWAQGRIQDSTRAMVWLSWVFAVFWNLVSLPVGFVGIRTALQDANPKLYLVLLFPLFGAGLLVWAVRLTLRNLKYGTSWLTLSTIPGSIGRRIAGTVRIPIALQPEAGFEATLSCLRRVATRRGRDSSASERILWQEEVHVRGEPIRDTSGLAMQVPVSFCIPADATASDSSNPRHQIIWRLAVSASVAGVDYHSVFEVPVFRTGESLGADDAALPSPEPAYRQPPTSRITVTRSQRGTEIFFAAARNPGMAGGIAIFTVLWTALIAWLTSWDAPALFFIVFGAFEVVLVFCVVQFWLGVSRVRAGKGSVSVAHGYIVPGRERTIETAQIEDITLKIGLQAGTTPYYDVVIVRKDGKQIVAGRSVRDKREAEWLAEMIRTSVGLRGQKSVATPGPSCKPDY